MQTKKIKVGILLFGLLVLYYFVNKYTSFTLECPIHFLTGLYCPGCGITRMLFSLLKLQIYQAFRFNPLVFIMLVLYIIYIIIKYVFRIKITIPEKFYYGLIVILIVYGVLRNIPLFYYLQPTIIK